MASATSSIVGLVLSYMAWHEVAKFAAAQRQKKEFHKNVGEYNEASKQQANFALEEQVGVEE
eukprot:3516537-Karenia_brevis.AAC.1